MPGPQGIYPHTVKDGTVRYEARVHQRAGQKPLSKTFRRLTDAKKWKRTMEGAKDRGEPLVADKRPLHEYLTSWLAAKASGAARDRRGRRRAIRARTLSDYQHLVKRWIERPPAGLPELGACRLDHLTTAVLDAFYAAMTAGKHTTARGVRSLNGVLGQALTEAVRKRLILHNPTDMADVPQVDVRPAVADSEDADEAAQAMDERQAAAFSPPPTSWRRRAPSRPCGTC